MQRVALEKTYIRSLERLEVWQRAMQLTLEMYRLTGHFPKEERFGLVSQLRRASVSIPSNIAEGHARSSRKEFLHFLAQAYGSSAEVYTQLVIAQSIPLTEHERFLRSFELLAETQRMLLGMRRSLLTTR